MKRIAIGVILSTIMGMGYTSAQKTNWNFDPNHAKIGFSVTHMMVSDVEGYFKKATATLNSTKNDFSDAVVVMTADANSIFTDNEKRDAHLQSPDFFEVDKYPTLTFKSFYFKKTKSPNTYFMKGNLTMHGVTKPVALTVVAKKGINPVSKKEMAGFKISGKLNRSEFGIGSSIPNAIVSDEVIINCNVEFDRE